MMKKSDIRILHITNGLGFGGVQKIIYQLCNGTKDDFSKVMVASCGGEYVSRLTDIGVDHLTIPDITNKKLQNMIKVYKILSDAVKRYNINVIHCHHRMAVFYAKFFHGKAKIIYNNHTIYSDKPYFTHFVLKNILIVADGIQAKNNVTNFFKISEKNVKVIYNAVDPFDGIKSEIKEIQDRREKGDFIVLDSSRLHPQKGINYFIDAAKILVDKGYKISFFIVGDGVLHDKVVNQIKDLELQNNIILLGFRKDIKNVISQADILVLTSIYEGLPLTPMEAFSVKRAAIGTNIEGTREVIEDGINGLLAETKNPQDIAEKIERVYLDRKLLNKLSENAYKTYKNKFSDELFIKKYVDLYEAL